MKDKDDKESVNQKSWRDNPLLLLLGGVSGFLAIVNIMIWGNPLIALPLGAGAGWPITTFLARRYLGR